MRIASVIVCAAAMCTAGCKTTEPMSATAPAWKSAPTTEGDQSGEPPQAKRPDIDEDASALLRRMSNYLGGLGAFTVTVDHATEVVLTSGQKLEIAATSVVQLKRPNKLRSDRRGEVADVSFRYDGETITLYGRGLNAYVQVDAPKTLDAAIDFARSELDLEAPGSDLLYSDSYDILLEDVVSGMRVGGAEIDGMPCQHLAFRGHDVDWQIWIQDGLEPLPRKFVITTKDVKGNPEFSVLLHDWQTAVVLSDDVFSFVPPPGAKKIVPPAGQEVDWLDLVTESMSERGTR